MKPYVPGEPLASKMEWLVERNIINNCWELHMALLSQGTVAVANPLIFETHDPATISKSKPMLELNKQQAQALIDALWAAGIRPTSPSDDTTLKATQAHLEDMRKIAFSYLDLQK